MGSSNSPEAWFESLSTHPIFTSPTSSSSSSGSQPVPVTTAPSSSGSRRRNTFGISALDHAGPQDKGAAADEGDDEDDEAEMLYDKHGEEVVQKKSRVVVRGGKELIAVVGREVRLVDLKEVKEGKPARYWVLRNPDIDFTIHQISLNPTNKLLVLVGSKQVGVIMLPAIGSLALGEQTRNVVDGKYVRCKGTKIAHEIYSQKAESRIVKAKWHPWGEHGTSLLILTDDTILREFDTSHSSTQPLQAVPLHPSVAAPQIVSSLHTPSTASSSTLPTQQAKRKSTFTAEDVSSKTAVSFDLGKGDGEWGALAIWGCMKNGDVWTICPFLPEFAVIPEVYVETLNLYLGSKAQQYRLQNPSSSSSTSNQADLGSSRQSIGFSSSEHDTLGKKLAAQQKWARSLSRQIDAHKASSDGFTADDRRGCHYPVRPPRDGRRLKRQGPYLVQPEPRELPLSEEAGWGIEGVASDIVVLGDKSSTRPGAGPRTGMNVVGVAWVDGRVDLCVEAQKVEAEWEVDDNQDWAEDPLLTLVTFDSIDLQLLEPLESASESFTPLICNPTTFTVDPMDSSSLFVHHVLGAHWIGFRQWKTSLSHIVQLQDADEEEKELGELWKQRSPSQSAWIVDTWSGQEADTAVVPVIGSVVLADIELGYAFLAIASDKTAAARQLNEFDDIEEDKPDELLASRLDKSAGPKDASANPSSYLGGQAYNITEESFDVVMQKLKNNVQIGPSGGKRIDSVSEEDLKMIGSVMQGYGEAILDLKQLSGRVEGRADLQVKEVALQLQRIKDAMRKVADLRGDSTDDEDEGLLGQGTGGSVDEMKQRYDRILRTQRDLASRLAHVQGKLINSVQPDLSDPEKAWQAEMERVAEMMKETGEASELTTSYQKLRKELDAIKPKFEQMQRENDKRSDNRAIDVPTSAASGLEQEAKHVALVLEKLKKIRIKVEDLEGVY